MHGMNDEVNMRRYGGLGKYMPITAITFGLGYLAIIGVPPFAGFYSKDKIIETAFNAGGTRGWIIGIAALLGALITSFYMTRVIMMTFVGNKRWNEHAHPHESPFLMWGPMALLAVGSVASGFILSSGNRFVTWLEPVVNSGHHEHEELLQPVVVTSLALAAVVIGVSIAILKYRAVPAVAPEEVSVFTKIARRDLLQDDVNEALLMRPGQRLTNFLVRFDYGAIDGLVRSVARTVTGASREMRLTQTGYVRSYAFWIVLGALALLLSIFVVTL